MNTNRTLRIFFILTFTLLSLSKLFSQVVKQIDPPFWWVDMKINNLQLMIYGDNISSYTVKSDHPELIKDVEKTENPNYLFINFVLPADIKPSIININFLKNNVIKESVNYEFKSRNKDKNRNKGFDNSDVIYLLLPDRFSNGNKSNDTVAEMLEKVNRSNPDGRHGGDIQGIINHIDYVREFGATTLWVSPLLENNQHQYTYHGYAVSNYYKIDPRHGTNENYVEFVNNAHMKGLKVIMDVVLNHCGSGHWWMKDLPSEDWIHQFPEFTRSNYRSEVVTDPYASAIDKNLQQNGWFDINMPDLNQQNMLLATYLIQNTIWWTEYSGVDGIRLDTQPYSDKEMISQWAQSVLTEYPNLTIIGEAWLQEIAHTAYWQKNSNNTDEYSSNIPVVTDFPMHYAIEKAFNEDQTWTDGIARLYYILSQDFLYESPMNTIVFLDNHDLTRIYSSFQKDINKLKMAIAFQLTTRGIPSVFYGTELLMEGFSDEQHGIMRKDFPGGWPDDSLNCFTSKGRNQAQNEIYDYYRKILHWRETKEVIHSGKLVHFIPENNIYVYFRYNEFDCVMVVLNNNSTEQTLNTTHFIELLSKYSTGYDIISNTTINDLTQLKLNAKSAMIIELK